MTTALLAMIALQLDSDRVRTFGNALLVAIGWGFYAWGPVALVWAVPRAAEYSDHQLGVGILVAVLLGLNYLAETGVENTKAREKAAQAAQPPSTRGVLTQR